MVSVNSSAGRAAASASRQSTAATRRGARARRATGARAARERQGRLGAASYLSADEPLRPRLAASDAEVTRLKAGGEQLQAQDERRCKQAQRRPGRCRRGGATPRRLRRRARLAAADGTPRRRWPRADAALLLALALGFALGWHMLDRTHPQQYGGLRICWRRPTLIGKSLRRSSACRRWRPDCALRRARFDILPGRQYTGNRRTAESVRRVAAYGPA